LPDIPEGSLLSEEEGSTLPKVYELYWDVAQAESFAAKPH
jgi:hypothetical protein